ncbi:hypothetical protein DVH24_001153 [Malus domestica]|uniref:Uncharacterized protein n=1 Tax=Malus domestica TaxID=3750 RepID=A0A498JYG0_MALDO|nr:hypothetical protein DVH24_001153 [Malus domestica]
MVGDLDYLFMHLAFGCFCSEHFVSHVALSLISVCSEFILDLFYMPCSSPNTAPHRESLTIYQFKVPSTLFGKIMGVLSATGGGDGSEVVMRVF